MPTTLRLEQLSKAVSGNAAAFRARTRLQPAGGAGDKIFPPTFAGAVYQIESRYVPDREDPVLSVVLDTVQSQANRMEEALLRASDADRIRIPIVASDFTGADLIHPVGRVTALEAPHRIADAIFRDSDLNGSRFRRSEEGQALDDAGAANATPLYRLCPTALVFGLWDSAGPRGGLGVKFERALVSEVVGIGIPPEQAGDDGLGRYDDDRKRPKVHGIRRDPLGVRRNVLISGDREEWSVAEGKAKGAVRPSEFNHGNIPFDSANTGLTVEYAEQTVTLSLIALRRLRFPVNGEGATRERDDAARTVLAALGLCAATLAFEDGFDFRSRCVLWPEGPLEWELLAKPGAQPEQFHLTGDEAAGLLEEAVQQAAKAGVEWRSEPLVLRPSDQLVKLVRLSQESAVKEGGDAE